MYLKGKTFVESQIWYTMSHFWSEAPDHLEELRQPHEHDFRIIVGVEVHGENRVLSCEDLTVWVINILDSFPKIVPWSCETMARKIATRMSKNNPIFRKGTNPKLKGKSFYIQVFEEDNQGASFHGEFAP